MVENAALGDTQNWRGKPLRTFETIVDLIGTTSTAAGLHISADTKPALRSRRRR
jgi:hypothetical protein